MVVLLTDCICYYHQLGHKTNSEGVQRILKINVSDTRPVSESMVLKLLQLSQCIAPFNLKWHLVNPYMKCSFCERSAMVLVKITIISHIRYNLHLLRCVSQIKLNTDVQCDFSKKSITRWYILGMYDISQKEKGRRDQPQSLPWRHSGRDSVSNHQPHDCLLNGLFRRRSKKSWKPRVTGLCAGNSPGTGEFSAQMASNAENVSIWWRHHVLVHIWSAVWWVGAKRYTLYREIYRDTVTKIRIVIQEIWWRYVPCLYNILNFPGVFVKKSKYIQN